MITSIILYASTDYYHYDYTTTTTALFNDHYEHYITVPIITATTTPLLLHYSTTIMSIISLYQLLQLRLHHYYCTIQRPLRALYHSTDYYRYDCTATTALFNHHYEHYITVPIITATTAPLLLHYSTTITSIISQYRLLPLRLHRYYCTIQRPLRALYHCTDYYRYDCTATTPLFNDHYEHYITVPIITATTTLLLLHYSTTIMSIISLYQLLQLRLHRYYCTIQPPLRALYHSTDYYHYNCTTTTALFNDHYERYITVPIITTTTTPLLLHYSTTIMSIISQYRLLQLRLHRYYCTIQRPL